MIRSFLFSIGLTSIALASSPVQVLEVTPTVLFPNAEPLHQLAWLSVVNSSDTPVTCNAVVTLAGQSAGEPQKLELPAGASRQDILIPDIQEPTKVRIDFKSPDGANLASIEQDWQPQRKWIVYVIKSSHEDFGYEDYIFEKQRWIANHIDQAKKLGSPRENPPDAEGTPSPRGYHYTLETLIFQRNYTDERSEAAWRKLVEEEVKTGKMDLMGAPSGVHPQWMDYEELARMTYPGRREMKDRFDLDLDTYLLVDNPSVSWSAAQAIANAGFKYVMRLGQPWRTGKNNDYATTKLPAIFWWEGPDGKSRVLYAWRAFYADGFWFGQPDGGGTDLSHLAATHVNQELQQIQSGELLGPYPYDAMIVAAYSDHEIPKWDNRALRRWQNLYRYPEIRIAGIPDFFAYMERKYGESIPVERGETNNFSGDYAAIDPASHGWKRRAARLLPIAEGSAALANLLDTSFHPPAREIERAFTRMFDFTEHSWPTSPPADGHHLFNAAWGKHQEGKRALDDAEKLVGQGFGALFRHVPTGDEEKVLVFNPLAHARTDLVVLDGVYEGLTDKVTDKAVETQIVNGNQTLFIAEDLPAYGYKVFSPSSSKEKTPSRIAADADTLSNEFYKIRFDTKTGAILSIYDKELDRELVDSDAKYQFNQPIWVRKNSRDGKQGKNIPIGQAARLSPEVGSVKGTMKVEFDDPNTGASITQSVILYDGIKRIDIVNDLEHVRAMHVKERKERYRENIYYAFPVDVEDFTARVEYPGGVVRPYDDQFRWGSHDFLNANRWVDVSNKDYGVTMAPWNATTVNFGDIRYNQLSVDYKPENSHLYSYALSNRMAGLLELHPDEWNANLGYSFTSHAGDWNTGTVTQFGWSIASPPETFILPAGQTGSLPDNKKSFLSIDQPNVQLVTLKQSTQPGRGWIVRLVETDGKAVSATVDLSHFPIQGAVICDLVENDQEPLKVTNGQVTVKMDPFSFATIRFFGTETELPSVRSLQAEALSDASVKLTWEAVPDADGYLIYRSEDPDEPASAYSVIGRTLDPTYVDENLKIDTSYYYHVAPLTKWNQQGPVSEQIVVQTDRNNVSPPAEVTGLGIVRFSPSELKVYWDKTPAPDIARYHVYRSKHPNIDIATAEAVATLTPTPLFLQTYLDTGLTPETTYFYQVVGEDWAGNRQQASPETSATTPAVHADSKTPKS